jgi:hypothetical protein
MAADMSKDLHAGMLVEGFRYPLEVAEYLG